MKTNRKASSLYTNWQLIVFLSSIEKATDIFYSKRILEEGCVYWFCVVSLPGMEYTGLNFADFDTSITSPENA